MNISKIKWLHIFCGAFIGLIISMSACTERIDISTDDAPPYLVIYGYITSDTMQHSIRISRSTGYFDSGRPRGISNAVVSFLTDGIEIPLTENDTVPGLYQTADNVYGVSGKTYTLNVWVDFDEDGFPEQYQAPSYLPFIGAIDSIQLVTSQLFKDAVELLLYAQDTPEENYYSIHVSKNDTVLNDSLSGFFIMDDLFFNGAYMNGVVCFYFDQDDEEDKLRIGDVVVLKIDAVNKDYATFIGNAQTEYRGSIPIFGGPPANVETNIRSTNPASTVPTAGFFSAYPSRYARTVVKTDFDSP